MHFGGAMFFTDYSMSAMELARALEERGFESVWAPEHSHIPLSRKTPFPGGGDLPKQYYDAMDPFVVLGAASQVTKNAPACCWCSSATRSRPPSWSPRSTR
jgi:alkanesulfonate monooxygenase SsuD/methylene tetrahydromethanopterin reductase-like flavin-dependent oxidoreductase (luciferase family)